MAKLWILGIGGWVSSPTLGHTSILVEVSGRRILLDAGEGVYRSLRLCTPFDVCDLDAVIVTHRHGDHVLGLPTLVQFAKVRGCRIRVLGPSDALRAVEMLLEATAVSRYREFVEFQPLEPGSSISLGSVEIRACSARHSVPSVAVRIDSSELSLIYTGDTAPTQQLVEFGRGCRVVIHEASSSDLSYSDHMHSLGHSTIYDAIEFGERVGAKLVVAVHLGFDPLVVPPTSRVAVLCPQPCTCIDLDRVLGLSAKA